MVCCGKSGKVWCVEYNPDLVREARNFLSKNENGHKVEVVEADAFDYLPPEPVGCRHSGEMIHVAMVRRSRTSHRSFQAALSGKTADLCRFSFQKR